MKNFKLEDVEKVLPLKSWWAIFFVLPFAKRLTIFIANKTQITPNQITFISLIFRLLSGISFLTTNYYLGALFYYIAYLLDCIDGALARLKNLSSEFGRYFDHLTDLFGDLFILISLLISKHLFFQIITLFFVLAHLSEYYISYLTSNLLKIENSNKKEISISPISVFLKWRNYFFSKNIKSFLSFPDYEAFIFILIPLLRLDNYWFNVAAIILFLIVNYTIFSSFISILIGEKKFP